jgi:hypothetical protein
MEEGKNGWVNERRVLEGADALRDCVNGLFAVGRVRREDRPPSLEGDPSGGLLVCRVDGGSV